jgi:CelD/BcsL family acetyltransferase involved in cellulose biosynthesis
MGVCVHSELLDSVARLESLEEEWDALAVAAANPVAAPAWIVAWLRRVARDIEALRVIAVRDSARLIGVVPLYETPRRRGIVEYRAMSDDFGVCPEPLALPGREWDVAAAVAELLGSRRPRPDIVALGPMSVASHWTRALRTSWPDRIPGLAHQYDIKPAPVIILRGRSVDDWYASLGSKMRQNLRRTQRKFQQAGGTARWTTAETLRADAEAFARLHLMRWGPRGDSRLADLGSSLPDWIEEVGRDLVEEGRFRMGVLEVDGSPICVDFNLLAGEELAAINVGWDERYAKLAPARIAAARLVEAAYGWGCHRIHLGRAATPHKLRLANGDDPSARSIVLPPSPRLAKVYARVLPVLLNDYGREIAERSLTEQGLRRVRSIRHFFKARDAERPREAPLPRFPAAGRPAARADRITPSVHPDEQLIDSGALMPHPVSGDSAQEAGALAKPRD